MQVINNPLLDAALSDICIGTSAAPTYFPAHYFRNQDTNGNVQDFNLVDGGLAANNPVRNFFNKNPMLEYKGYFLYFPYWYVRIYRCCLYVIKILLSFLTF